MSKPFDLASFITKFYGPGFSGNLVLWSKQTKKSQFFGAGSLSALIESVEARQGAEDLYLGVGTQKDGLKPNQRGSSNTVQQISFMFADIDFADDKASDKNYPPNNETALEILKGFPFPASLIQNSGNGLHVLWKFSTPLACDTPKNRKKAQALSKFFQGMLVSHFKEHGYDIDAVGDLARLYRVPGSKNHKGKRSKNVRVLFFDPAIVLDLSKLESLDKTSESKKMPKPTKKYPPADHGLIADKCAWYAHHTGEGANASDEPNWQAAGSITACCKNGEAIFHAYSQRHSQYSQREAVQKFRREVKAGMPRTCANIQDELGQGHFCDACPFSGKVKSPVHLGRCYDPMSLGPIPLGYNNQGMFVLLDQTRQIIIQLSSNQLLSSQHLIGLAERNFWEEQYPAQKGGFSANAAGEAIIEACRRAGAFDPTTTRGRGVWHEHGKVVVNLGDPVPEGMKYNYLCFSPLEIEGSINFDAKRLLKLIQSMPWRNPNDAILLFGWFAIAPICGALTWRPHCFVFGQPNSGKTTLHNLASSILMPLRISVDGQSTEAGIRQSLGPDALPIVMDEFETDQNMGRLQSVVRMARSASSAESPVLRGTPEGKALQFSIKTTFFWSAVNITGMSPADQTRILQLELGMHESDPKIGSYIDAELSHFADLGPNWCGFMANNVQHILDAIDVFKQAMPNIDSRLKTDMATVFSGAFVALEKRVPSLIEAQEWVADKVDTIDLHGQEHERDDAQECLDHLLSHLVRNRDIGDLPLGQWIREEYDFVKKGEIANAVREGQRVLANHDIKISLDGPNQGVVLRYGSPAIEQIFAMTRWARGSWKKALGQVQGVQRTSGPIRFPNVAKKHRGLVLPFELLPAYQDSLIIRDDF